MTTRALLLICLLGCGGKGPSGPKMVEIISTTPDAAVGAACASSDECPGAMCRGEEGCQSQWQCLPDIPCTRDLVEYCGCDGSTFEASGQCPGRPYRHKGPCT